LEFLEQEHISPALLDGVRAYRAQYPAEPHPAAALSLLWERGLGGRHRRAAVRREPAARRQQGDRQERAG